MAKKPLRVANPIEAQAVLREAARRRAQQGVRLFDKTPRELTETEWEFFLSKCHEKQQVFLRDRCRFKALKCPRRTGKTTATLFETLIHARRHPGSTIAYIVPDSKSHARRLFWRPLKKMNTELKLGLVFYEVEKRVVTPEGTEILLFGAHDKDSPAQLRGDAYSLALLDECKDFGPHFEELILEALLPGLGDYGGTLVLAGTPGNVLAGKFYEITTHEPEGWSVHKWIKSDNIFLPSEERDLEQVLKTMYAPFGLTRESPKFRREQLAEWCTDDTERAYLYDAHRNGWDGQLPPGPHKWMFCLGLDLGERDANAFVVGAFATTHRHLFIVDQYARPGMSIDEIAAKIRELEAKWAHLGRFVFMVADTGGYGRGIVTDLQNRHSLPLEAADKGKNKLGNIAQMNADFLSGRIKCAPDTPLAQEWARLVRKIRPSDQKVMLDHSDLGDAALYMWKASLHWASAELPPEPLPGSKEYWQKQEIEYINKAINKRRNMDWWGSAVSERDN